MSIDSKTNISFFLQEEFCVVFMPKCIKRNTEPTQAVSSGKPTNDDGKWCAKYSTKDK